MNRTWVGAGIKVGGFLFAAGTTTFVGAAFRLDGMPAATATDVTVEELDIGLGVGGGFNFSLFFAFNVSSLWEINNAISPFSATFSIAIPDAKIGDGSLAINVLKNLDKIGTAELKLLHLLEVQDLSGCAQLLFSSLDATDGLSGGAPSWIVVDIPVGGWGAEAMVGASVARLVVSD